MTREGFGILFRFLLRSLLRLLFGLLLRILGRLLSRFPGFHFCKHLARLLARVAGLSVVDQLEPVRERFQLLLGRINRVAGLVDLSFSRPVMLSTFDSI